MRAGNSSLAAAVAVASALIAALAWSSTPRPAHGTGARRAPISPAAAQAPANEPSEPRIRADARVVSPELAAPAESSNAIVAASLAELAARLEAPRLARWSWDVEVAATAASLPSDARDTLAAALRESPSETTRVAAAELLRASAAPRGRLDAASWKFLRATAARDDAPALATAAARALAALGGDADRDELAQLVATSPDAERRCIAAWALADAPNARLVGALDTIDEHGGALALSAIGRWSDATREAWGADQALEALALDTARSAALRERALAAMSQPSLARLVPDLSRLARDAHVPDSLAVAAFRALAASDDAVAAAELASAAYDQRASAGRRLAAAEALARVRADEGTAALRDVLATTEDARLRRRACFALPAAAYGARDTLERAATSDDDASVRDAATLALERTAGD